MNRLEDYEKKNRNEMKKSILMPQVLNDKHINEGKGRQFSFIYLKNKLKDKR